MPDGFHFLRPTWLLALPVVLPLLVWMWRRDGDESGWMRVCEPHLLRHLASGAESKALRWPVGLVAAGWLASCIALAGPAWERLPQPSFENTARSVLVLGLSPSLDARDLAPSRLARARHKLLDAVDHLDGGSVGLVVYRDEAFPAAPLTDDAQVLRELIPLLETNLAPGRSVHPARGLEEAQSLLEPVGIVGAQVLLVSDGADDDPAATRGAAAALSRAGARVSVLGVAGSDAQLASVAEAGGGTFAPLAATDTDLDHLLNPAASVAATTLTESSVQADAWRDMGVWLVWVPLLLAPLAFRKGWATAAVALALVQLPSGPAQAGVRDWFERPDQQGARAFEAGDYATSAERFEDPSWEAAARYRAGDYEAAANALEAQSDPTSLYNRGNALAKSGRLAEALDAYDHALAFDPGNEDAQFNRDLVKELLESQSQPPSEQQSGPESASDDASPEDEDAESNANPTNSANQDAGESASDTADGAGEPSETAARASENESIDTSEPGDDSVDGEAGADGGDAASPSVADRDDTQTTSPASEGGASPAETSELGGATAETQAPALDSQGVSAAISPQEEAAQRWMAHLPDDPGGLLREKIRRDYLRKLRARQQGERR